MPSSLPPPVINVDDRTAEVVLGGEGPGSQAILFNAHYIQARRRFLASVRVIDVLEDGHRPTEQPRDGHEPHLNVDGAHVKRYAMTQFTDFVHAAFDRATKPGGTIEQLATGYDIGGLTPDD